LHWCDRRAKPTIVLSSAQRMIDPATVRRDAGRMGHQIA